MGKKIEPVLYPKYIEKEFKTRVLAFYDADVITLENQDIHKIFDFSTLLCTTFEHQLLTFTRSIPTFPYLEQVIAAGFKPFCSEEGTPLGIRLKGARNTSRWIASATAWGFEDYLEAFHGSYQEAIVSWLALMREAYTLGNVGTQPSPGSWGQAMFRQSFKEQYGESWRVHRHRRPPGSYAEKIRYESSGARSEVLQLNVAFDIAYENDRKNSYGASLAEAQPTGKTYRIFSDVSDYSFYFVECEVTIHAQLALGVFPVRVSTGRVRHPVFPTQPGIYRCWLWHREITLCREEGLHVRIIGGFAWREATYDFQPFVEKLSQLRDSAPDPIKPLIKLALVATVGRLGMPEEQYTLVPWDSREVGDRAVAEAGIAYDWWIHQEHNSYPQSMPHIFSHVLMLTRLALYQMAKRCMQEELNVIATNTDAVITEKKPAIPLKGEQVETGDWTALELHHVKVTANRHLDSDEKSVHPGIPRHIFKSQQ